MASSTRPTSESAMRLQRSLDLRVAIVLFFLSVSLLAVGVVLNDAREELLMFSDIEYEQYKQSNLTSHWDKAQVLLQTAGSYRNVILSLWYLGVIGLVLAVAFLGLAYAKPKK